MMTSDAIYSNGTAIEFAPPCLQDLVVSSYYGPGSWAAWCITLFGSWIALLRDDYTHDLHFIVSALYTNGAAVDAMRYQYREDKVYDVRLDWYKPEAEYGKRPLEGYSRSGLPLFDDHLRRRARDEEYKVCVWTDSDTITDILKPSADWKNEDGDTIFSGPAIWMTLYSQWYQLLAAQAVLVFGTLHASAQLLVCLWKARIVLCSDPRCDRSENGCLATAERRKRNWILLLGLILPSIALMLEVLPSHEGVPAGNEQFKYILLGSVIGWVGQTIITLIFRLPMWELFILFRLETSRNTFKYVSLMAALLSLVRCLPTVGAVLFSDIRTTRRCHFMPCTPIKLAEYDQTFALFLGLVCFLYEFWSAILEFFKFLLSRIKALVFKVQPNHTTGSGAQSPNLGP